MGQQMMGGPYGGYSGPAADLDYIPNRARRTSSIELGQNNEVSKNRPLKSEKNRANSTSKTRSRVASKKRKTKNKIVNGRLLKEGGAPDGGGSLKRSHSNSNNRSRKCSKSPNTYSNNNIPAGRGVPDPYSRSRSNNSLKRPTPRRMQPTMNNSLSMSTNVRLTKEFNNNTSQISFMSQKSRQILKSMNSRRSQGKTSANVH